MRTHKLVRFDSGDYGTLGRFERWVTLEEEDKGNQRNISRIPSGVYVCERTLFRGKLPTFEVTGVSGRSLIKWHPLNTEEGTEGCIGIGMGVGTFKVNDEEGAGPIWKIGITNSRIAHEQFMKFFNGVDRWRLFVEDWTP